VLGDLGNESYLKDGYALCRDVLLEKSPLCPELTKILDLEETEIHYGKSSLIMARS
jgi:hypothetical protein